MDNIKYIPDAMDVNADGTLRIREKYSEAAMYTALWSGLFAAGECPALESAVRDMMGPAPLYAKDPNVGGSQLFIGLCIRLDLLARRGYDRKLYEDLRAIYDVQLREGPGTLWENGIIDTSSRCHGFTSHAGVHLVRDILGLSPDDDLSAVSRRLTIAPHVADLRWARGTWETPDGLISLEWQYSGDSFSLSANLPENWSCNVVLPREARALDPEKVTVSVHSKNR